jgi:hypothetical protein
MGRDQAMPRLRPAVPAMILLAVAGLQVYLAHTSHLTPWKGGGFGMFSTLDHAPHRNLRVFVEAPERSEEIAIPPSIEDVAARTLILPTDGWCRRLAEAVVARELRYDRPVHRVRIEIRKQRIDPVSLAGSFIPLRSCHHDVGP